MVNPRGKFSAKLNTKKGTQGHFDVVVIGGGASGMMAAGRAAELGKSVLILEKNRALGEKLKITGGGRCNVTNAEPDIHILLGKYSKAKHFLFSPYSLFGVKDTFEFFEKRGLPLVVEANKRAFPKTQRAIDVFNVMYAYARNGNVTVRTESAVTEVKFADGAVTRVSCGPVSYTGDQFIFATGGLSAPETGSTGDGFNWLKKMGHSVETSSPNVVPLKVKEQWVKALSGVSLSFMKISFFLEDAVAPNTSSEESNITIASAPTGVGNIEAQKPALKKQFSKIGKVLFTHFGLSGPLILNSAHSVKDLLQAGKVTATIDMYPDTDFAAQEKHVLKAFDTHKNKLLKNVLEDICPAGVAPGFAMLLGRVLCEKKVHSVSKDERKKIVHLIKEMPITIEGLMGYDRAVVSDGGVILEEIDMKTMRSKLFNNLYLTGDLLHINRPSGGYSLQLCWTTGFVAGSNAAGAPVADKNSIADNN